MEFIYKYGHAGVTKASVTIIFDNRDKAGSPPGYQQYDQISVTRQIHSSKSKYFLNGATSTGEKVKSLFLSVQLNVNNPHFLIFQGKITQVVHMKSQELLSQLEETAGTGFYENKKSNTHKLIQKKELKIQDINGILREKIEPQVEKLKQDRLNYKEWSENEVNLNRLRKLIIAYDYDASRRGITQKKAEKEGWINTLERLKEGIRECTADRELLERELAEYKSKQTPEIEAQMKALKASEATLNTTIVGLQTDAKNKDKMLDKTDKALRKYTSHGEELLRMIHKGRMSKTNFESKIEGYNKEIENKERHVTDAER